MHARFCERETWGGEAYIQQAEDRFHATREDKPSRGLQQSAVHEPGKGHPAEARDAVKITQNTQSMARIALIRLVGVDDCVSLWLVLVYYFSCNWNWNLYRIDLAKPDQPNQIELGRKDDSKVYRLFLDPTGENNNAESKASLTGCRYRTTLPCCVFA